MKEKKNFKTSIKIITATILVCVVVFLIFGLSPTMKKIYYNPTEKIGTYTTNIDLSVAVYGDLFYPRGNMMSAGVSEEKYGDYIVTINLPGLGAETKNTVLKLKRGEFDRESFNNMYSDLGYNTGRFVNHELTETGKEVNTEDDEDIKELKKLPETSAVSANVVLKKDVPLETILKKGENFSGAIRYVGIRTSKEEHGSILGMNLSIGGVEYTYDGEKYPKLLSVSETFNDSKLADWEEHWKSLLKYSIDDKEFNKAQGDMFVGEDTYSEALAYTNEHGIEVYGIYVDGTPNQLLKLKNDSMVDKVYIEDVKASTYSR